MDAASSKKLLSQKQAQYEALQNQYSTCVRILRETEGTLARLTKVGETFVSLSSDFICVYYVFSDLSLIGDHRSPD